MPVHHFTDDDVRGVLTMDVALAAVETAFRKLALDEAVNVPRSRCQTDHVTLHVLPAAAKSLNALGLKANTTGKAGRTSHVFLFDPKTGDLAAILDSETLGRMRTGAASGIATKLLARMDSHTLGVLGCGRQARTQILAVCKVRPIESVRVFSRDAAKTAAFAAAVSDETGVAVEPAPSAEAAVRGADVVVTATNTVEPVLFADWLSPGQHLNLVGSNLLGKVEAEPAVFARASLVVVDSKEQAKIEAGDFVAPIRDHQLNWGDILELAPLLAGRYPGRQSPADLTIFESLGLGIEDVAVAAKVVELARAAGRGREILP